MSKRVGGFIGQDGLNAPDSPTSVSASAGDAQATVSFTAPSNVGGAAITGYNVQTTDGSGTIFPSYDVENAVYDSTSFSVSSQDTAPEGLSFSSDGARMYVVGNGTDAIYQYDLSAAYDISSAVYNGVSFDNSAQATAATGMVFNNTGTKMYLVSGGLSRFVYQYSVSTAFDLSGVSYDGVSLDVGSESTAPQDLKFSNDGSKLFVLQSNPSDAVFQYSLSSNFDLSTASYDSVSFSVTGQETTPTALAFNTDGTKMFILGTAADLVLQYSLSTAFDLSSASYDNISFSVTSQDSVPTALAFNSYGDKMYVLGNTNDAVFQYTTGIAAGDYPTASPITVTGLTNGTAYTFRVWALNAFGWSAPSDASGSVTPAFQAGLFSLIQDTVAINTINEISITSAGNASDFGDLTSSRYGGGAVGSSTRGVFAGGTGYSNVIDYVSFDTAGNAVDFGDLNNPRGEGLAGAASSTRGLFAGGYIASYVNVIEYITIASVGNAIDFGDLTFARGALGGVASTTRAAFGGGFDSGSSQGVNIIDYVTIATTGNATDFGDLSVARDGVSGCSNATRGLFVGGRNTGGTRINTIDYITIASTGNATDFGDRTVQQWQGGACSSSTRGVFAGGSLEGGGQTNVIDFVEIASTGNASNFGDLLSGASNIAGCSNAHGGLS